MKCSIYLGRTIFKLLKFPINCATDLREQYKRGMGSMKNLCEICSERAGREKTQIKPLSEE
jgi:hypothetical protein